MSEAETLATRTGLQGEGLHRQPRQGQDAQRPHRHGGRRPALEVRRHCTGAGTRQGDSRSSSTGTPSTRTSGSCRPAAWTRGSRPSTRRARVPRRDRPGARHGRSSERAVSDARLLRRGDGLLPRARAWRRPTKQAHVDEDEDIEAKTFELREARDMVRRGEIVDMKTLVGLGFDLTRPATCLRRERHELRLCPRRRRRSRRTAGRSSRDKSSASRSNAAATRAAQASSPVSVLTACSAPSPPPTKTSPPAVTMAPGAPGAPGDPAA